MELLEVHIRDAEWRGGEDGQNGDMELALSSGWDWGFKLAMRSALALVLAVTLALTLLVVSGW